MAIVVAICDFVVEVAGVSTKVRIGQRASDSDAVVTASSGFWVADGESVDVIAASAKQRAALWP